MWEIDFYESASGDCPTREFLRSLHKKGELPYVTHAIDRLRDYGNQLRRPHADFLQDGIYELRISVRRKQFRLLYFFFFQGTIVISHGLRKEGKINPSDIEKAKQNKTDYFSRHERK